jgi:uncharacterized protein YbjT (DUF2867 family)
VNVLLLGATGMIGQGVLRECLRDARVQRVTAVVRRPTGQDHEKIHEIVHADIADLTAIESDLTGLDACFWCLGVSAVGLTEAEYSRVTFDLTMAAAATLVRTSPQLTFIYVSGAGTDSTEHGRRMWARVKGRVENALLRLPFKGVYMFRPGLIVPLHGIRSATGWYNAVYALIRPVHPILKRIAPRSITTTEQMGRAMIAVAHDGYSKRILEMDDLVRF